MTSPVPRITLGIDVYGTLIDPGGVVDRLRTHVGERAEAVAVVWRRTQLTYSFRRGLMQAYVPFSQVTQEALAFALAHERLDLSEAAQADVVASYASLPAFPDAETGLAALDRAVFRVYAFSNGRADDVDAVLRHAGLRDAFDGVVSVEPVRVFKPSPAVYAHFRRASGAGGGPAWLISGNPFDVLGAQAAGLHGCWVRRDPASVFDPWGVSPTLTVPSLSGVGAAILACPV